MLRAAINPNEQTLHKDSSVSFTQTTSDPMNRYTFELAAIKDNQSEYLAVK